VARTRSPGSRAPACASRQSSCPCAQAGAVLAGRSLREVELRESDLLGATALAGLFILGAVAATIVGIEWLIDRRSHAA
jgi:hypothetical protein